MGRVTFALQFVSYLLLFVIIVSLFVWSPIPAIMKFIQDPFRPDVSISMTDSLYDEELGRLKLVIDRGYDVDGNYLSFAFYPEVKDRKYAFMRKQLLEERTVLYFDISGCIDSFEAISVSLKDTKEKNYFSKQVKIRKGSLTDYAVYHNLCSFCEAGGSGSDDDPLVICDCEQLQDISKDLDAHYVLGGTIDCTSPNSSFETIGDNFDPFSGSLDGDGNVIYGLNIDSPEENYAGLFGVLFEGKIKEVGLSGSNVSGALFVGGLVGRQEKGVVSKSFIENSYVRGTANVGGLIGYSNGKVENSYSLADVESTIFAGGLIGGAEGEVLKSYFAGNVTSLYRGLVGKKFPLAVITSSYFDYDKLPGATVDAGIGYSTGKFGVIGNFEGWDFEKVWWMGENSTYPSLRF